MRRRRDRADCVADTQFVENVDTWRMDRMGRHNLIAWKPVLVQEHNGGAASGEEGSERSTGASCADNDDVMT